MPELKCVKPLCLATRVRADDCLKEQMYYWTNFCNIFRFNHHKNRFTAPETRPNKLVWLGTGNKLGARDSSQVQNCDSWHSDSLAKFGYAVPLHSPRHYGSSNSGGNHTTSGHHRDRQQRSSGSAGNGTTQAAVFDNIQKYPCRMPLIVLCVETVAQAVE